MIEDHLRSKKFWGIVIVVIILAIIFCHGHDYGYRSDANNLHAINVVGHGEVFASPDIATFSFSALGQAAAVPEAQNKMTTVANMAIDFLKKNGINQKDIQTTDYNVNPTYKYTNVACPQFGPCPPSGNQTISGYEVTETLSVKLRDPSKSGAILSGVGSLGVSNISSLSFTIDNPDALKEQARQMAIQKAQAEGKQLAKDLGVHLGRVISFTESGNSPSPIMYAKTALSSADSASVAPTPDIQTGQNKITSDVTITYEIR